jgi:dTMP kinase
MTERLGTFITFEGPDGSGKSTQMRLLAERLRSMGREVVETQEPGGTNIGLQIRAILLDSKNHQLCAIAEMLLYFAARAQNFDERILPAWQRGAIVLSDRFTDSTLAYQGGGRGLGEDVVMQLHNIACHGLNPDLTICIDVDTETGLARTRTREGKEPDRMDQQAVEFHHRVREIYLELGRKHPDRIKIVDGSGSMEDVSKRVWRIVEGRV